MKAKKKCSNKQILTKGPSSWFITSISCGTLVKVSLNPGSAIWVSEIVKRERENFKRQSQTTIMETAKETLKSRAENDNGIRKFYNQAVSIENIHKTFRKIDLKFWKKKLYIYIYIMKVFTDFSFKYHKKKKKIFFVTL